MARKQDGTTADDRDMSLEEFEKVLGQTADEEPGEDEAVGDKPRDNDALAAKLTAHAAHFGMVHAFTPGQMVQWKKNMKNRRFPAYGEPVVVLELLGVPVYDGKLRSGAGSPYFREPLTLAAGRIDEDGDFVCFYYDRRRMEPFSG